MMGVAVDQSHELEAQHVAATDKRYSTVRAQLALRDGHVVHQMAEGGYLVTWRGLSRECRNLDELEAHARRVGAMG